LKEIALNVLGIVNIVLNEWGDLALKKIRERNEVK
jgi:hypothetical protein